MASQEVEEFSDKSSFMKHFEELRPDFFLKEMYESPEIREQVAESIRSNNTRTVMFSSIPMKCRAAKCEFADTCPLQQQGIAPLDKKCPYEMSMVSDFMSNLMEDLTVDPENMVEVSMIRDLVDQEIQHIRKSNFLAREDLIQENVIGLDNENRPIIKKELHLAVELEDKILKRKKEIRNQLLATREAKAKAGQGMVDSAQVISHMFEEIREVELTRERLMREKLGTIGQDSYIESQTQIMDAEIVEE